MTNWLLRRNVKPAEALRNKIDVLQRIYADLRNFAAEKQIALTIGFVGGFQLAANAKTLNSVYEDSGWNGIADATPDALTYFSTTQSWTVTLQALFYHVVVNKFVRAWENAQVGVENSDDARAISNYLIAPFLVANAVSVTMATATGTPLNQFDWIVHLRDLIQTHLYINLPIEYWNTGHGLLLGLCGAGMVMMTWPKLLNPSIPVYRKTKDLFKPHLTALGELIEWLKGKAATEGAK